MNRVDPNRLILKTQSRHRIVAGQSITSALSDGVPPQVVEPEGAFRVKRVGNDQQMVLFGGRNAGKADIVLELVGSKILKGWAKENTTEQGWCLERAGGANTRGYIQINGKEGYTYNKLMLAHHAALFAIGELPEVPAPGDKEWECSHRCHNKRCVKPDHLEWESHSVNMNRNGCNPWVKCRCDHAGVADVGCGKWVLACQHSPPCLGSMPGVAWKDFKSNPRAFFCNDIDVPHVSWWWRE